jgi:ribosomal protein L11 methyltransferase
MDWLEIRVTVPFAASEAVESIMLDAGSRGTSRLTTEPCADAVICGYAECGSEGEQVAEAIERRLQRLDESLTEGQEPTIERVVVAEEDWAEAWKVYYKPMRIGRRLVIKPTWELFEAGEDDIVIEIDPKMAFGTGSHASTRLCLEVIEEHVKPGMHMIDVGCGTGILAIAAARLGATVTAIDIDQVAVRTCHENLLLNDATDQVTVKLEQGLDNTVEAADIIVANITCEAVAALAPTAAAMLVPGALYVCSGFTCGHAPGVRESLELAGLGLKQERQEDEWLCIVSQKP